jgi:hypothetical protein
MPPALAFWHASLCVFAILNAAAWVSAARRLTHRGAELPADVLATRRLLLWLSAVYVVGCAFRSALPMIDAARICLYDTPLSRVAVGRSVATIAELCFVAQWALLLREATGTSGRPLVRQAAFALLPLGVLAETFSWLGVLTGNNLLHAFENSVWTVGAVLVLLAVAALRESAEPRFQPMFAVGVAVIGAYIAFMTAVDVPMYLQRWYALGAGLPIAMGVEQVLQRCTPVQVLAVWRDDMPWLTLYFSAAVWLSIALVDTPPLRSSRAARVGVKVAA